MGQDRAVSAVGHDDVQGFGAALDLHSFLPGRRRRALLFHAGLSGRHHQHPLVEHIAARQVSAESDPQCLGGMHWQCRCPAGPVVVGPGEEAHDPQGNRGGIQLVAIGSMRRLVRLDIPCAARIVLLMVLLSARLFFSMWFVSVMRAKFPAFQMPAIMFSILTDIGFTSGPRFQTTAQCEAFIKELLTSFFTAFGIAAGVSLFIFPVSSRTVVFKGMAGYIEAVQKTLKAQSAYLQSLEKSDMFAVASPPENGQENKKAVEDSAEETDAKPTKSLESPESVALKQAATAISGLYGKINGDLAFGKMEFAWGKLDQSDLNEITVHFRSILIPL